MHVLGQDTETQSVNSDCLRRDTLCSDKKEKSISKIKLGADFIRLLAMLLAMTDGYGDG